jgi:hypothetical protein
MLGTNIYTIIAQCRTNGIYPWLKGNAYSKLSNGFSVKINLQAYLITTYDSISDSEDLTMVDDMSDAYHLSYIDGYPEYDIALLKIGDQISKRDLSSLSIFDKNLTHINDSNKLHIKHLDADDGITSHQLDVLNPKYIIDHLNSMQYMKVPLVEFELDPDIDEDLLSGIAGAPITHNGKIIGMYTKYDMNKNTCIGLHSSVIVHMIKTFRLYKKCSSLPFEINIKRKGKYTKTLLNKTMRIYGAKLPQQLATTFDSIFPNMNDINMTLLIPYDHKTKYVVVNGLIFTTFTERMLIEHSHRNIKFSSNIVNGLCHSSCIYTLIVLLGIKDNKTDKISKFVIDNKLPYVPIGDEYDLFVLSKVNDISTNNINQLDHLKKRDIIKSLKFTNGITLEL